MSLIGGGHNFMTSMSTNLHKTIFVTKIHRNWSNIHKVMTLCASWHSKGGKGLMVVFTLPSIVSEMQSKPAGEPWYKGRLMKNKHWDKLMLKIYKKRITSYQKLLSNVMILQGCGLRKITSYVLKVTCRVPFRCWLSCSSCSQFWDSVKNSD